MYRIDPERSEIKSERRNALKVKINVTRSDIKAGERESCVGCPVARAALRALSEHGYQTVHVFPSSIDARNPDHTSARSFNLPKRAGAFIDRFDTAHPKRDQGFQYPKHSFEPFSFFINI